MSTPLRWMLALVLCAPGAAPAAEIAWRADRPLAWRDFEAPVARNAAADNVAVTTASLSWTYEYEIESSAAGCTYRILDVRSAAVFDGARSWVRPEHRTAQILAHEQGHFDLTQIYKLVFDERTRELVGTTGSCRGRDRRRATADVEQAVARTVGAVYERVWRAHTRAQRAYDTETAHGLRRHEQARWLELIAAGLRGRRWTELGMPAGAD